MCLTKSVNSFSIFMCIKNETEIPEIASHTYTTVHTYDHAYIRPFTRHMHTHVCRSSMTAYKLTNDADPPSQMLSTAAVVPELERAQVLYIFFHTNPTRTRTRMTSPSFHGHHRTYNTKQPATVFPIFFSYPSVCESVVNRDMLGSFSVPCSTYPITRSVALITLLLGLVMSGAQRSPTLFDEAWTYHTANYSRQTRVG